MWVLPDDSFGADLAVREAVREAFLANGVQLAVWRVVVGNTLDKLRDLGYPGMGKKGAGEKSIHSSHHDGGADDDEDAAAGQMVTA